MNNLQRYVSIFLFYRSEYWSSEAVTLPKVKWLVSEPGLKLKSAYVQNTYYCLGVRVNLQLLGRLPNPPIGFTNAFLLGIKPYKNKSQCYFFNLLIQFTNYLLPNQFCYLLCKINYNKYNHLVIKIINWLLLIILII